MIHEPNNLVVLDWDNTLFPTNQLIATLKPQTRKLYPMKIPETEELIALSKLIYDVLSAYIDQYKASNIRIVSASRKGWIEASLYMVSDIDYFKRIYNLIFIKHHIKVIHPLNIHLPFTSEHQVYLWKYTEFRSIFQQRFSDTNTSANVNNIISIGDTLREFKASKSAANDLNHVYVHRIKLIEHPSIKDMMIQMHLLLDFCGIFELSSAKDKAEIVVDYALERKKRML